MTTDRTLLEWLPWALGKEFGDDFDRERVERAVGMALHAGSSPEHQANWRGRLPCPACRLDAAALAARPEPTSAGERCAFDGCPFSDSRDWHSRRGSSGFDILDHDFQPAPDPAAREVGCGWCGRRYDHEPVPGICDGPDTPAPTGTPR